MPNGDDLKNAILKGIGEGVARIETRIESDFGDFLKRIQALELTHIEKDVFNNTVQALRVYAEEQAEKNLERGEARLDDKMIALRGAILSDVDTKLTERFNEFKSEQVVPLFEQLAQDREERRQAERDRQVQQWRNRVALGTAILLFLVSMWQTFRPKPDMARDYVRPIERLSDITQ